MHHVQDCLFQRGFRALPAIGLLGLYVSIIALRFGELADPHYTHKYVSVRSCCLGQMDAVTGTF